MRVHPHVQEDDPTPKQTATPKGVSCKRDRYRSETKDAQVESHTRFTAYGISPPTGQRLHPTRSCSERQQELMPYYAHPTRTFRYHDDMTARNGPPGAPPARAGVNLLDDGVVGEDKLDHVVVAAVVVGENHVSSSASGAHLAPEEGRQCGDS